jgi:tetratricopeptide (TPR) repeat protein
LDPNLAEGYKALGLGYGQKGWRTKALEAYLQAVKLDPNNWPAISNIALYHLWSGNFVEAMIWARKGLRLEPTNEWPHYLVGTIYTVLGQFAQAEVWLSRSLKMKPDFDASLFALTWLYVAQDRMERATETAERRLALDPTSADPLSNAGSVALWGKDYVRAREYFEKAIAVEPDSVEWVGAPLGHVLTQMGSEEGVQELLGQSLKINQQRIEDEDEDFDPRYRMAEVFAVRGNKEEALHWLQEAIDSGWRNYIWAVESTLFENLHEDVCF